MLAPQGLQGHPKWMMLLDASNASDALRLTSHLLLDVHAQLYSTDMVK